MNAMVSQMTGVSIFAQSFVQAQMKEITKPKLKILNLRCFGFFAQSFVQA